MKKCFLLLGFFGILGDFLVSMAGAQTCEVSPFRWNEKRVEIVENPKLGPCASLKVEAEPLRSVTAENFNPENPADVEFTVTVAAGNAGIHRMNSLVAVREAGREKVSAAATKHDGLPALVQVNDGYVTSRFIVSPPCSDFSRTEKFLGLFNLPEGESVIRFWLPKEVEMAKISVWKFRGPKVPEGAENYVPRLVPDCEHPRVLMNREKLPEIRRRLTVGENAVMWEYLQEQADQPWIKETALRTQREWECNLKPTHLKNEAKKAEETGIPSTSRMALGFNSGFMRQAQQKAFTALMRNDAELARDTAEHFIAHVRKIEFGNVLDITREVGQTIYTGAMVYDWLYEWLTEEEKAFLAARLMELAVHLECSYPPFGRTIFNGHGNESMILRDTLALGIAIYERNPEPYRYCAWLIMDQLVPVRELQYRSPRHNQGFSYAFARVAWEYQAAALFYGFSNDMVFAPNILSLRDFIVHMRLPSGETILDGDGTFNTFPATMVAESAFIISALGRDSLMKGEALRSFGFPNDRLNPILFLILNNPTLEPTFTFQDVPRAIDTGEILPSHILRTGWGKGNLTLPENFAVNGDWRHGIATRLVGDPDSTETVVEYKGGGHFSLNHQHLDAGAFQIWYRGWLTMDLGLYGFYGTPYDMNFNKKSGSHNCLFVMDPDEKMSKSQFFNDGGQRVAPRAPATKEEYLTDTSFHYGKVLRSEILPDVKNPKRTLYQVDLTAAYSDKIESYVRTFCWLNLEREDVPVVLIIMDDVTARKPEFRKWWQINTPTAPTLTDSGFISTGRLPKNATIAPGRLSLTTLLPCAENREVTVRSLTDLPPEIQLTYAGRLAKYDTNGWQTWISPKTTTKTDRFLNVLQVLAPDAEPLPIRFEEKEETVEIEIGGETCLLNK